MSTHVRATPASDEFREWFVGWVDKLRPKTEEILQATEQLHPILFVFSSDDQIAIVPLPPFQTMIDKDIVARLHKRLAERTDECKGVIMIVEAWGAHLTIDQMNKAGGTIANHPERFDIVMFNGIRGTMQLMADIRINKDRTLGEMSIRDPTSTEAPSTGRFIVGDQDELDS